MTTQLIMIEGLPGSGKTTVAQFVSEILTEKGVKPQIFLEGNLDHPADYDGVAFYSQEEFAQLLDAHVEFSELLESRAVKHGQDWLIPYRKMKNEYGSDFPDELLQAVVKHDIYELPFDQNVRLISDKWRSFKNGNLHSNTVTIFECCFIQNPVTMGTVKYGVPQRDVMDYVLQLEAAVKSMNPLLIYVDQNDIEASFTKALTERPKEWSEGFIDYYTNQGYGKMSGFTGLDGTIQVLQERNRIESKIFDQLTIDKRRIDNSDFDPAACKAQLIKRLDGIILSSKERID